MAVVQGDRQEGRGPVVGPATTTTLHDTHLQTTSGMNHTHHMAPQEVGRSGRVAMQQHDHAPVMYTTINPFQTQNLFDESNQVGGYVEQEEPEALQPRKYRIQTGSGRGHSQEPSELPASPLSMILEEDLEGAESNNSSQKSHDHTPSPAGRAFNGVTPPTSLHEEGAWSDDREPWYQQDTSQDMWQTTPAYRPRPQNPTGRGEWPREDVGVASEKPEQGHRRLSNIQQLLVTEAEVPVLQVRVFWC